jgi:hypothetical protein
MASALLAAVSACSFVLGLDEYDRETDLVDASEAEAAAPDGGGDACTADGESCGECGRSCLGRTCLAGGICRPANALGQFQIISLALGDGGTIYLGVFGGDTFGVITKVPESLDVTGTPPLALLGQSPVSLAVSDNDLLWGGTAGGVGRLSFDFASSTLILDAGPAPVTGLVTSFGATWATPDDPGGGAEAGIHRETVGLITRVPHAWSLVASRFGGDLVFAQRTSGGAIGRAAEFTGQRGEDLVANAGFPMGIAADDDAVYWADCTGNAIRRYRIDDPKTVITTLATDQLYPFAIAVDDVYVYWTTYGFPGNPAACANRAFLSDAGTGTVVRAQKDGGGTPLVLARGLFTPYAIAVRPGHPYVYWVTASPDPNGGVWSVPR